MTTVSSIATAFGGSPQADKDWVVSPDLPGLPNPQSLPIDVLPPALRDHVLSVSASMQVPADMPCLLALACVSAAVAGTIDVQARPGWIEPVNIYTGIILPPASRKSPSYKAMTAPLREWEADEIKAVAPDLANARDRVAVAEKSLTVAIQKSAAGQELEAVAAARKQLSKATAAVPPDGRLLAGNITPEKIEVRMALQGGRLAILEPEPGPLQVLAGRYDNKAARLDELKKAHDCEPLLTDRMGRESVRIERPALTLGIMLQPGVLERLSNVESFRIEGALARFLWCAPPHGLGKRLTGAAVPHLDQAAQVEYGRVLQTLLRETCIHPHQGHDDGAAQHVLTLTPDALAVLHDFESETEEQLGDGGQYEEIRDWAGKMVGQSLRIAALLSVSMRAGENRGLFAPIEQASMAGATTLLRALSSHALHVLVGHRNEGNTADLAYLLRRLRDLPPNSTESQLREASRGRSSIRSAEDVSILLDELEARNCVRRVSPSPSGNRGRPSSPAIALHPQLLPQREVFRL